MGGKEHTLKLSDTGLALIKEFEGLKLNAYFCSVGVLTIGWGTTAGVKPGDKITEAQAEEMLRADVVKFERGVFDAVKVPLAQHQFDALVVLAYNIGLGAFRTSTLLRLLNKGELSAAAKQFDRWNRGGGKVLAGLTRRRAAERKLFEGRV